MTRFDRLLARGAVIAALAFGGTGIAGEHRHMMQRAAANHFELAGNSCCAMEAERKAVISTSSTIAGGKARAATQELRKPGVGHRHGLDLAHAPRPITASKDPDFEQKLRDNARKKFELAPLK